MQRCFHAVALSHSCTPLTSDYTREGLTPFPEPSVSPLSTLRNEIRLLRVMSKPTTYTLDNMILLVSPLPSTFNPQRSTNSKASARVAFGLMMN